MSKKIKLSSDQLKLIAIFIMLIDHAAYALLHLYLTNSYDTIAIEDYQKLNKIYGYARDVGRLAFPIFAFMLVEGFFRTRSVVKYAVRIAIAAIVSEIPFNLALYQKVLYPEHQNVMLTMLIALLAMALLRYIESLLLSTPLKVFLYICVSVAAMDIGQLCNCDYRWYGIGAILVLYFTYDQGPLRLVCGATAFCWEKFAPASFLLLYFYDDTKKPKLKYLFYLFYPVHLILLYFCARLLGL